MMKILLIIFLSSINCYSENIFFASKKFDFTFTDRSKLSLMSAVKGPAYQGVININSPGLSSQSISFYHFAADDEIKVTDEYCQKKIDALYGPRNNRSTKLDYLNIEKSIHGSFCSAVISIDSDIATIKKRYLMIGFIKAKSVLLEWSYIDAKANIQQDKILEFWNSLK